jgi:hypothetical protein
VKTRLARLDWRRPPTWLLGLLLALATWSIALAPPSVGLDGSWIAGISMATHESLHYGTEFVFSYGPLGFLALPLVFYSGFGVLSLLYLSLVYIAFCIALVWALRRRFPAWLCLVLGFALLGLLPLIEEPLILATIASLILLERKDRPGWAVWAFIVPAAGFAAVEALAKLSTGPAIVVVLFLALLGARVRRLQLGAFAALFLVLLAACWFATGQGVANIGPFLRHTVEVAGAYSTAMMRIVDVAPWKVTAATIAAAGLSLATVIITARLEFRDRRARNFAVVVVAICSFAIYKEGVVRADAGHLSLYFSSACILWIGLPWRRGRWLLAGAVVIALVGIPMRPTGTTTNYGVIGNVKLAGEQVGTLFSGGKRDELIAIGRAGGKATYALEPKIKAALAGHTVSVEPWEAEVAWTYDLPWRPLPVFQNYTAYTANLDRLNAAAVESPQGPERILREYPPLVFNEFTTPDLDGRWFGWDSPEQQRAVLCHFAPLQVNTRWEVLGRIADRCGPSRMVASVSGHYGETINVPPPGPGEVVYVRIHGAGLGALERVTNFLLHARTRHILLNGGTARFRLIPETAGDGLLMWGGQPLYEEEGALSPLPQTATIKLEGASGDLLFDFYAMKVESGSRALKRTAERR